MKMKSGYLKYLWRSYIEARYNPEFKVNREDIEDLWGKLKNLERLQVKRVSEE